jgi:hypothetical protein
MTEIWEASFTARQLIWGLEPARSAVFAKDYFQRSSVKSVLLPGVGYGRNAKPFLDAGMSVTGIEISATAIALARSELGLDIPIHHGSVTDMPYDDGEYDAVFCYGLLYLLDAGARNADDRRGTVANALEGRDERGRTVCREAWDAERQAPALGALDIQRAVGLAGGHEQHLARAQRPFALLLDPQTTARLEREGCVAMRDRDAADDGLVVSLPRDHDVPSVARRWAIASDGNDARHARKLPRQPAFQR